MIAFICYFFPAVLALWVFESLSNRHLTVKQCIFRFCWNALAINFICFALKKFIFGTAEEMIVYGTDMIPSVAFNYILIVVPVAIIFAIAEVLFSRKVQVTVEDFDDEKKETK